MSAQLLTLYHRLPGSARSAVATMRGWYLNRWRYGAETSRLTVKALERDRWSAAAWDAWRAERLGYILHRAATLVPYYREHWQTRRARGGRASWGVLAEWAPLD